MSDRKPPRAPTHHHAGRSPEDASSAALRSEPVPIPIGPQIGGFTISKSVGGTMYGTTPGGTVRKFDTAMLRRLRESPFSKTPPAGLEEFLGLQDVQMSMGGSIYGTTPGGTRKVYRFKDLRKYRHSPLSRSPPSALKNFPAEIHKTFREEEYASDDVDDMHEESCHEHSDHKGDDLFEMDM